MCDSNNNRVIEVTRNGAMVITFNQLNWPNSAYVIGQYVGLTHP